MSPRKADPQVRVALSEAAARLLGDEGPSALTTRRLAAEVGTSTTAVYTHFGSKEEIVRAMVTEGFDRLAARLAKVRPSDDPVADIARLGWAYRRNALANPHLYAVMFGRSVPEYRPHADDRSGGLPTLQRLVNAVARAADVGRIAAPDPWPVAVEIWMALHGAVSLEIERFDARLFDPPGTIGRTLLHVFTALGDDPEAAAASIASTRP